MPDLPDLPPEWPHQLRAAGALALIGIVWLLVMPVAATAYVVLELAARVRNGIKPGRPAASRACQPVDSATPPVRRQI